MAVPEIDLFIHSRKRHAMFGFHNVRDVGAVGDGVADDSASIQKAIDAASIVDGGGVVWLPPGRYAIDETLRIPNQVVVQGSGWASRNEREGTWICIRKPSVNVEIRGEGATLRGVAFFHEQPQITSSWQPAPRLFSIHVGADDVRLEDINLYNSTNGILIRQFTGGVIGRVTLNHIWGRPLSQGIVIQNALDVVKVNDIHFWPFWEIGNTVVDEWVRANGKAIVCGRADNPQFSNIFTLGYNRGFQFVESTDGPTSRFAIVNADCDACETGLEVGGINATGMVCNFSATGVPGNVGIAVVSPGVRLQATNVRLTNFRANGIRTTGDNTKVFLQNVWIELWNRSGQGFPAIEAVDGGAEIYLGRPLYFGFGKGALKWRGANGGKVITDFDQLSPDFELDK